MTRTLMSPTHYPGFSNITFDAQQTFRALLHALSHPGSPMEIGVKLGHPDDLHPACAAACCLLVGGVNPADHPEGLGMLTAKGISDGVAGQFDLTGLQVLLEPGLRILLGTLKAE